MRPLPGVAVHVAGHRTQVDDALVAVLEANARHAVVLADLETNLGERLHRGLDLSKVDHQIDIGMVSVLGTEESFYAPSPFQGGGHAGIGQHGEYIEDVLSFHSHGEPASWLSSLIRGSGQPSAPESLDIRSTWLLSRF